jgi:DNA repair exonuclease SbcCD ATPase subunit
VAADDLEPRVRGLEQANAASHERDEVFETTIRQLAPLVELYGRLDERFNILQRDVNGAHEAIRHFDQVLQEEREERRRGQQERKEELEAAIEERQQQHRDLRVRYAQMMVGIVSIFLTSLGGVVVAWITSRGGVK